MRAGDLRHVVQLQRYAVTSTGDRGQPSKAWTTYATVPAMIEELGGRKLELARQLVATATHKVTLRYLDGVSVKDRVQFGGLILNVGSVQDRGLMHFSLDLLCTSLESGGNAPAFVAEMTGGVSWR